MNMSPDEYIASGAAADEGKDAIRAVVRISSSPCDRSLMIRILALSYIEATISTDHCRFGCQHLKRFTPLTGDAPRIIWKRSHKDRREDLSDTCNIGRQGDESEAPLHALVCARYVGSPDHFRRVQTHRYNAWDQGPIWEFCGGRGIPSPRASAADKDGGRTIFSGSPYPPQNQHACAPELASCLMPKPKITPN